MDCKICKSQSVPLEKAMILGKYTIQYYACINCRFIQTEEPYWLDEAYASAIAKSDIGLIGRNLKLSKMCSSIIPLLRGETHRFLDYGGGNGMFVRLMRDLGFNFYWKDKFSKNQFAEGFEAQDDQSYSALTAFEVFEHLVHPMEEIEQMLKYSTVLVFTTRTLPYSNVKPNDWWYFALDTGQHVSLYSREALMFIANKFGLKLSSNGRSFHVLSPNAFSTLGLKTLSYTPFATLLSGLLNFRRTSLLDSDYSQLTGHKLMN